MAISAKKMAEIYTFEGKSMTLSDWARQLNHAPSYLYAKIQRIGLEAALGHRARTPSEIGRIGGRTWRRVEHMQSVAGMSLRAARS